MIKKPKYHLIVISKLLIGLGSLINSDTNDRIIDFLRKKGLLVTEKIKN